MNQFLLQLQKQFIEPSPKAIDILQNLQIGHAQIAYAFLVLVNVKPATIITIFEWNDSKDDVEAQLQNTGLATKQFTSDKYYDNKNNNYKGSIAVTREKALLQEVIDVSEQEPIDHERMGTLMGYPPSAIEAFTNQQDLWEEDSSFNWRHPITFALSQSGFEQEAELLTYWRDLIKKYLPYIQETMAEFE